MTSISCSLRAITKLAIISSSNGKILVTNTSGLFTFISGEKAFSIVRERGMLMNIITSIISAIEVEDEILSCLRGFFK
ncbi:hypothetical protein [Halocella sp. SP3-1]|uniref:hypothetical protein n=1 Tax=Halocella sp. SP3-1 TaxID=2382161 RepID=UPI000F7E16F9|nr:hypothetical protein [Halocella sp. SP3-1]